MKKKLFFLFLIFSLILSSANSSFASDKVNIKGSMKVQYLIDNKIVEGRITEDPARVDYALDKTITRAESSKLLVYLLELEDLAKTLKGTVLSFSDVKASHWASGFINVMATSNEAIANGKRIVVGFPDGKFYPEKDIFFDEMSAMLVRIVKADLTKKMEEEAIWATSYMRWAEELGLLEDVEFKNSKDKIDRKNAFIMLYNAREILNKNKENKVDFKDKLGIVSRLQMNQLELNQDSKNVYKITEKTIFTDGTSPLSIYRNSDIKGSLVRIIVDENKNVDRIIELGNPVDLALEGRWFNVAEKTVSAKEASYFEGDYTESNLIKVGGVTAEINKDTKFFAADVDKNILGEIKAPGQVFEKYKRFRRPIKNVYMGYNEYGGSYKEAKVIVFNDVDIFQGKEELRRITVPVTSNLTFSAESMIGGEEKVFSLGFMTYFPSDYDLDFMDVILMRFDSYESAKLLQAPKKLIDYSKDNIYEVVSYDQRELVVRDKHGYEFPFTTKKTAIFRPGQLEAGKHVQILMLPSQFLVDLIGQDKLMEMDLDVDNLKIEDINFKELLKDIRPEDLIIAAESIHSINDLKLQVMAVSVVEDNLRGRLPFGFRTGKNWGYVTHISGNSLVMAKKVDNIYIKSESYQFFESDRRLLELARRLGFPVAFDVQEIFGNTAYIQNVRPYLNYRDLEGLTNDVLQELISLYYKDKIDISDYQNLEKWNSFIDRLDLNEDVKSEMKLFIASIFLNLNN